MDKQSNFCLLDGTLIDASGWIPPAPEEYDFGAPGAATGCNHLQCDQCGATVRHAQGLGLADGARVDAAALYTAVIWAEVPGVTASGATLYACKCALHVQYGRMAMAQPDPEDIVRGYVFPAWRCAGHPRFQLPGKVADIEISAPDNIPAQTQEILQGSWQRGHPNPLKKGWPGFLLWRWYNLLRDAGGGSTVIAVVLDALRSADVEERATAIFFFKVFPDVPGAAALAPTFRAHRALYESVAEPFRGRATLDLHFEEALQHRLERVADPEALAIVHEYLLAGARLATYRFTLLKRIDPEWLEANRDAILRANPELEAHWG